MRLISAACLVLTVTSCGSHHDSKPQGTPEPDWTPAEGDFPLLSVEQRTQKKLYNPGCVRASESAAAAQSEKFLLTLQGGKITIERSTFRGTDCATGALVYVIYEGTYSLDKRLAKVTPTEKKMLILDAQARAVAQIAQSCGHSDWIRTTQPVSVFKCSDLGDAEAELWFKMYRESESDDYIMITRPTLLESSARTATGSRANIVE
jgi:hypothetical protein